MDVTVEVPPGTEEATPPIESFDDMMLDAKIMMDIKFKEYDKPTPNPGAGHPDHLRRPRRFGMRGDRFR